MPPLRYEALEIQRKVLVELCLPSLERDQNRYSTSNRQVVLEASAEYEARKHAHSSFRPLVDLDSSSEAEIETTEQLPLKVSKLEQDLRQTNRQLRLGERMRQEVEEQVVSLRRDLVSRDRTISRLEGQMKQLEHKTDHILDLVDKIFQRPQPSVRESHTTPGHEEDVEMIPVTEAPSGINKSTAGATKRNISVVVDNPEYSTQNDLSEVQPKARRLGPGHNTPRGIDSRGSTPQDTEEDSQSMISSADGRPQRDSTTPSTPDEQDRAITKVTMTRRQLKAGRFEDWLPQEVRDSVLTQFADWNKRKSDWHKNSRGSATICLSRKLRKIGSNGAEADSACNDCTAEGEVCVRYNGDGSITIVPLRKKDRRGTSRDKEYWLK
ncbi:hypothetical protein H2200_010424 [Cladophialophora chaetospira]|uniref:Uncharacterized protein n=1 Tax=Cladophialophora chaetospira TaxID=386627 RepID=A0AA38X1I9_9EURO|nr:hypothetical protein H2200_010424 [Cladophialophora chaetospira]